MITFKLDIGAPVEKNKTMSYHPEVASHQKQLYLPIISVFQGNFHCHTTYQLSRVDIT